MCLDNTTTVEKNYKTFNYYMWVNIGTTSFLVVSIITAVVFYYIPMLWF